MPKLPMLPMMRSTTPRARLRVVFLPSVLALVALLIPLVGTGSAGAHSPGTAHPRPTIVLVHGDWADGSSWGRVIERLQDRGYNVVAPPNPLRGPTSDAAYLASFLQTIPGPIVLAAHSYGGFVITNAARGNQNVKALVYIDAFIPAQGETLLDLSPGSCLGGDPTKPFQAVPSAGGVVDLYIRSAPNPPFTGFAQCFANGVPEDQTNVLAATQRPAALSGFMEPSGPPAWQNIPSWSLIGTDDHVITSAQQQFMSNRAHAHIATVRAGHLSLITRPSAVTRLIRSAVEATS